MRQKAQRVRSDMGFTLIELLVVIVILGILSAVVVFSVQGITDRGEEASCEASAQTIRVAAQAYYAQHGSYSQTLAGLSPEFISEFPGDPSDLTALTLSLIGGDLTYDPADGSVTDTCGPV